MFPRLPEDHPAGEYITTNLIANVLGLGWACTPAGLKAMEQLAELEKQRAEQRRIEQQRMQPVNRQLRPVGRQGSEDRRYGAEATAASNEMCTFLILNISSLQLIPVNMIAYRSQYGSANPAVIIAPALVATLFSTIIAIIYCKWKGR
jgi:spore maturation protein A